jgi:uncharacterized repeat protein (TIGR02543 family)
MFLDSSKIAEKDTTLRPKQKDVSNDTIWCAYSFDSAGVRTILAKAFIQQNLTYLDSAKVTIVPRAVIKNNHAPKWEEDTIALLGMVSSTIQLDLNDKCSDPDFETLSFILLPGLPIGDTLIENEYFFTPLQSDTGIKKAKIVAVDGSGLKDTAILRMTITPQDYIKPKLVLLSPLDSSKTSSTTCQVKVKCTDASGIAKVECRMGADSMAVAKTDSIYIASVKGLKAGFMSSVLFIATDSSTEANKDSLVVHITYDSTISDSDPPSITYVDGPINHDRLLNPSDTLVYKVIDQSGVDSIYWTLNGTFGGYATKQQNNNYQIPFTLTQFGSNRIVIFGRDMSQSKNCDSVMVTLVYNTKPSAITQTGPADNAVAVDKVPTFVWLGGDDEDGDTVFYRVLYGKTETSLPYKTADSKVKTITIPVADQLDVYTKYYWKIVAFTKVYPDTVETSIRTFTTSGVALSVSSPSSATINEGGTLDLSVTATGTPSPNAFQWYHSGNLIPGATSTSYSKTGLTISDSGHYYVSVSNGVGNPVNSTAALITILCKYPLQYSGNGNTGGTAPPSTSQYTGSQVTVANAGSLEKTGNLFVSWNTDSTGTGSNYAPGSLFTIGTSPITLYALWEKNKYKISYDGNGSNFGDVPAEGMYDYESSVIINNQGSLLRTGYTFSGWNTKNDGTGISYAANSSIIIGTADVVLYAQWAVNGMKLILSKNKSFSMGSDNGDANEQPIHTIGFTYDFWMDSVEVTQKKYDVLLRLTYASYSTPPWDNPNGIGDNYPVYYVKWYDAVLYCNALTRSTGSLDTVYSYTSITGTPGSWCTLSDLTIDLSKSGFRLPTEAEWEYACRAGTTTNYYFDSASIDNYAWHSGNNNNKSQPVAQKLPNAFKLYDMSGNVSEMCSDWWGSNYYSISPSLDPPGPATYSGRGEARVVRGGTWIDTPSAMRSASRFYGDPGAVAKTGFRCVKPRR